MIKRSILVLWMVAFSIRSAAAPGDIFSFSLVGILNSSEIIGNLRQHCPGTQSKLGEAPILIYAVQYETTNFHGLPDRASGAIAVPNLGMGPYPVVSYQRGTAINRFDVPSRKSREGLAMSSCYGSQGFVVSLPDYLGFGDSNHFHPYMHASTGATAPADLLRALRTLASRLKVQLSNKLFLAGYSAGGHATMALHHYIESDLSDEFEVTGSAPMAGPYDMVSNFKIQVARPSPFSSIQLGYLLWSWNRIYSWHADLAEVINSPYHAKFDFYFGGAGDWRDVFDLHGLPPRALIRSEVLNAILNDPNSPIVASLQANNLYNWRPSAPVNLIHGDKDINVPIESSILAHTTMTKLGAPVTLTWIAGKDHQGAAPFAYAKSIEWFNSLNSVASKSVK